MSSATRKIAPSIVTVVGIMSVILLWHILSTYVLDTRKYPQPSAVWQSLQLYFETGELVRDLRASLWRGLSGFLMAAVLGITIGIATGRNWWMKHLFAPLLHLLRALPPVAILPLFILWFSGVADSTKVLTIAFGSFFPIWLNTTVGAETLQEYYVRHAQLLTKSKLKILFRVILPGTMPYIAIGLRAGAANAFIMIFVSELAGANEGIGYSIANAQMAFLTSKVIAVLLVLASLAIVVDWILKTLTKIFFPWISKI